MYIYLYIAINSKKFLYFLSSKVRNSFFIDG